MPRQKGTPSKYCSFNTSANASSNTRKSLSSFQSKHLGHISSDLELNEAIELLQNARTSKIKAAQLKQPVEKINVYAKQNGLPGDAIMSLIDVAACGTLPNWICNRLIFSLIPRDKVPVKAVIKAVSWMCFNKASTGTQAHLLRWMVIVQSLVDDQERFHALYGMIFYFLQNETLCPHVCHLLYLLTRKEDVRLFRVKELVGLQIKMDLPLYITGLVSLYRQFSPHLVNMNISRQREYFKVSLADKNLRADIERIQKLTQAQILAGNAAGLNNTMQATLFTFFPQAGADKHIQPKPAKRRKLDKHDVPVPTSKINTNPIKPADLALKRHQPVPIEQIKSFKDLISNIDRIEMPEQIASILNSSKLQFVFMLSSDVHTTRFTYWLSNALETCIANSYEETESGRNLLGLLCVFTDFIQEGVPVFESFIGRYMVTWNGVTYRKYILKLLTRLRLYPFDSLYNAILEPLRNVFFNSSVYVKCQLMIMFTDLLRNWAMLEWQRFQWTLNNQQAEADLMEDTQSIPQEGFHTIFKEEISAFRTLSTIKSFVEFVDKLCDLGLNAENDHCLLMDKVLNFFDEVSMLLPRYGLPYVGMPSKLIVFKALLSSAAVNIARMCKIFCNLKESFTILKQNQSRIPGDISNQLDNRGFEHIPTFNKHIVDFCDALWRCRAFNNNEGLYNQKAKVAIENSVKVPHLNSVFSINEHQALVGYAWKFLQESQPEGKQFHPSLINQDHGMDYLDYLKRENLDGIHLFVNLFIKKPKAPTKT